MPLTMPKSPEKPPRPTRPRAEPVRHAGAGRPRDPDTDAAIRKAVIELIIEVGYDKMTMEAVARRAKAGKGSLYRRWPSKALLAVDAIADLRGPRPPELPDTGSLEGDIEAVIAMAPSASSASASYSRTLGAVVMGIISAARRDPVLHDAFETHLAAPTIDLNQSFADHAAARGEAVAGRDLSLMGEMITGMIVMRLAHGEVPDQDYLRHVLCSLVYPLITGRNHPALP